VVTNNEGSATSNEANLTVTEENQPPAAPVLSAPDNGATGVLLTPTLTTGDFDDPDGDTHARTQWQISANDSFAINAIVLEVMSTSSLTSLEVPGLVLDGETTYHWRAKFFDDNDGESSWSLSWSFETEAKADWDGGPVDTVSGGAEATVSADANIDAVLFVEAVDPEMITDQTNRPEEDELPFGLVGFKVRLLITDPNDPNYDPMANVKIVMSKASSGLYGWDPINGWQDLSAFADFTPGKTNWTEAIVTLEDGGDKDADGVQNGIIVDPSGPLALGAKSRDSNDDTCFITTAGSGLHSLPFMKRSGIKERIAKFIALALVGLGGLALMRKIWVHDGHWERRR
jgi:hypothetical protein